MQPADPASTFGAGLGVGTAQGSGGVNALTALPTTPVPEVDPASLVTEIVQALETPGLSVQTLVSYLAEAVAVVGFIIGAFDHQLGMRITTVPQTVITSAAILTIALVTGVRMIAKSHKQGAATALVASVQHTRISAQIERERIHAAREIREVV